MVSIGSEERNGASHQATSTACAIDLPTDRIKLANTRVVLGSKRTVQQASKALRSKLTVSSTHQANELTLEQKLSLSLDTLSANSKGQRTAGKRRAF